MIKSPKPTVKAYFAEAATKAGNISFYADDQFIYDF
jgi:hypothetical protein